MKFYSSGPAANKRKQNELVARRTNKLNSAKRGASVAPVASLPLAPNKGAAQQKVNADRAAKVGPLNGQQTVVNKKGPTIGNATSGRPLGRLDTASHKAAGLHRVGTTGNIFIDPATGKAYHRNAKGTFSAGFDPSSGGQPAFTNAQKAAAKRAYGIR